VTDVVGHPLEVVGHAELFPVFVVEVATQFLLLVAMKPAKVPEGSVGYNPREATLVLHRSETCCEHRAPNRDQLLAVHPFELHPFEVHPFKVHPFEVQTAK
jgi:hypothetical protein